MAAPTTNSASPASQLAQTVIGPAPVSTQPSTSNATTSANANQSQNAHSAAQLVPVTIIGPNSDASYAGMSESQPESDDAQQPLPGQPYKDGRIRNPVPSKLKGKTSNASGRFSVMHMDIRAGKDVAVDRDAAAKRTSENTALAAKMAYESGYQPHRKSNWLRVPEDSTPDPTVPFTGTTPYNHALYGLPKPAVNPPKDKPTPQTATRPLTTTECKEEQARLLTLLRSLQPVAVVDQSTFYSHQADLFLWSTAWVSIPPHHPGVIFMSCSANNALAWRDLERTAFRPHSRFSDIIIHCMRR